VKDYYKILGLERGASRTDIRRRWLQLAQKFHPDRNPDDPNAVDKFREAREAYGVLGDERKRSLYDLDGGMNLFAGEYNVPRPTDYFYCKVTPSTSRLNDEIEVSFTYTSAGRIFRRPEFRDFYITGAPFVASRNVVHEGNTVRETTLTYIVCPLRQGRVLIGPASIRIAGKSFLSDPVTVMVMAQRCYFMAGQQAGKSPYKFILHYEQSTAKASGRRSWRKADHTALVPRSNAARAFHSLGMALKVVSTVASMVYFGELAGAFTAAVAGNIAGWLNSRILYSIAGVKPRFGYAETYPVVRDYLERGYFPGPEQGVPVVKSHWIYQFSRAII
jgi:hypothetical protein